MSLPELVLIFLTLVGSSLILVKLIQTKLARSYRAFFFYVALMGLQSAAVLTLGQRSGLYQQFWVITTPLMWLLRVLAVRELCGLVLERYRGLRTAGRWGMYAGVVVAGAISVISLLPRMTVAQRSRVLPYLYPVERGVNFGLAVFLLFMMLLVSRFPVKLSRNAMVHMSLYTTLFLSNALSTLLHTFFGARTPRAVDLASMSISAACMWLWALLLGRNGEETRMNLPHYTPKEEARILKKLEELNETLLKVSHK